MFFDPANPAPVSIEEIAGNVARTYGLPQPVAARIVRDAARELQLNVPTLYGQEISEVLDLVYADFQQPGHDHAAAAGVFEMFDPVHYQGLKDAAYACGVPRRDDAPHRLDGSDRQPAQTTCGWCMKSPLWLYALAHYGESANENQIAALVYATRNSNPATSEEAQTVLELIRAAGVTGKHVPAEKVLDIVETLAELKAAEDPLSRSED